VTPYVESARLARPVCRGDHRQVRLRPAQAGDGEAIQAFLRGLAPQSRRRRFFSAITELPPALLRRLLEPDDPRALSLLALHGERCEPRVVGMANCMPEGPEGAEFGIAVADQWQGAGLGRRLLEATIEHASNAGFSRLSAVTFPDNEAMLSLATRLGFALAEDSDPDLVRLEKPLALRNPGRVARWLVGAPV
jgi:acetyltransferase